MKFKSQHYLCLLLLSFLSTSQQCSPSDEEFFVSFHPHLDAFWLNTDTELKDINFRPADFLFEMNQRNSKAIFNSMYTALQEKPQRKYFVTQVVFLKDWFQSINQQMKQKVKKFIDSGQLEITNGGWVENDEAVCYIDDIIDQYTLGHNFLRETFGLQTKIGWATDSFGHSHSQAAIQHLLGFQAQGIERIDDRYIFKRTNGSLLQFYWSAISDSNGRKYAGVYTHIRHFLHQFVNYRFESKQNLVRDYQNVNLMMNKLYKQKKLFRFIGNDFEQFIPDEFNVLQKAVSIMNSKSGSQCPKYKYGNPSDYFKAIQAEKKGKVPVRQSDFIPNFDQDHYWAGYYTTNPMLKVICKDFSRLTNLFRKIYMKNCINKKLNDQGLQKLLIQADELLAVMQHHDGITATSKYHIEELFQFKMAQTSDKLVKAIINLQKMPEIRCLFDSNLKKCNIQAVGGNNEIYLTILHQGAQKKQRIQIQLPVDKFFEAEADQQDNIFCNNANSCSLVFTAELKAGENVFKLKKVDADAFQDIVIKTEQQDGPKYNNNDFSVEITESTVKYTLANQDFINLSLVRSQNAATMTETETWNKYGESIRKSQRRIPGIYIMSNSGRFSPFPESRFTSLRVSQGKQYIKIWVISQIAQLLITVQKNNFNIIDVQTAFKPNSFIMFDYFLKIESKIKANGEFFHDMNGYLVSRRKIGSRLDYEWTYRQQDKINANTYPMCSFGYITNGNKKLVVFTDRAQGFTTYDDDLLINIDRLAGDDYKGVGQGYTVQISNRFKHRIGIVDNSEFPERLWQRNYDEMSIGFLSETAPKTSPSLTAINSQNEDYKWLKYTTFSLNKQEFVIRFFNMNDNRAIKMKKYESKSWNLAELGLTLKFEDIKETFANGNPISKRKQWTEIQGEINIFSAGSQDSGEEIVLEPLQIRSFRINSSEKLAFTASPEQKTQHATNSVKSEDKSQSQHFSRRCF